MNISKDLGRSVIEASGLELGPLGRGGPRSERDHGIVEDGSGMEGSSGRRITSGKLDVAEADFEKVGCGGSFGLDSGSCGVLEEGVW